MTRCAWAQKEIFHDYHDNEWGRPLHDDKKLFELLILEGAQAGLSWETILRRRKGYRNAYKGFDPDLVSKFLEKDKTNLLTDSKIIRNRLKIEASIINAKCFGDIQKEFGSFDKYLWNFTKGKVIKNNIKSSSDIPIKSPLSDMISKDLKKRGFKFVGSIIIYSYLQAVGIVDDHENGCSARIN